MSVLCSMVGASFTVAAVAEVLRSKKGVTAIGNAQIDTAQSKFGGASALFDGTNDYLRTFYNTNFTGDFTIECWARFNSIATQQTIWQFGNNGTDAIQIFMDSTAGANQYKIRLDIWNVAGTYSSSTVTTNTWYHFAVVRSGSTVTLYINGSSNASLTRSQTIGNGGDFYIGARQNEDLDFNGHIDEVRISNTARYTADFTPATAPFQNDENTLLLLHADGTDASTFFEDDNGVRGQKGITASGSAQIDTAQSKFGGASGLFTLATGDLLTIQNATDLNLGTGEFTVEGWFRPQSAGTQGAGTRFWYSKGVNTTGGMVLGVTTDGIRMRNSGQTDLAYSITLSTSTWYHIAFTRSGTTRRIWLDGVLVANDTLSFDLTDTSNIILGCILGNNAFSYNGYMDEIRISNTARYTANFTAPTAPFVNDANTLLLVHADGTDAATVFRDDNGALAATSTGTAVTFDGTGDYYEATGITTTATDSNKLLIAGTIYWAGGNNLQQVVNLRLGTGSSDYGFWVWINGGRMQCKMVTGAGSVPTSIYENAENSLTANAYNQFVIYWDTSSYTANTKIYVNGSSKAISNEGTLASNWNWGNTATTVKIGQKNTSQTGDGTDFNGRIAQIYIHNLATFPGIEPFWSTGPRDLGTTGTATGLAQPLVYHYGNNDTFRTNNGTGFSSYTLTANGNAGTATTNLPTFYSPRTQKGISALGNAQVDTAQSKFGGSSALFDGTGDYLLVSPASDFAFGTGNFTVEAWYRINSVLFDMYLISFLGGPTTHWGINIFNNNWRAGLINNPITGSTGVATGEWYHAALVRDSATNLTFYINGTALGTKTINASDNFNSTLIAIGEYSVNLSYDAEWNGWIDEIRISNVARYTAGFTPSTTPFQNDGNTLLLLHCDGTDASTVFFDDNGIAPYTP